MSRRSQRREGAGALELIEEAVHLLRLAPLSVLGSYYLGSLPFVIGFLYFWTDMSRGATAYDRCASGALSLALLFLWMKTWHSVFARRLSAQITLRPALKMTVRHFLRTAMVQTILQPSGLFLLSACFLIVMLFGVISLPLALPFLLPFGWVYAFYQNLTGFAAADETSVRWVVPRAFKQALLWPGQNHLMLGVMLLFGLAVLLNVASGMVAIPMLLKMLLGIETAFTRSPLSFLNTTFLATVCAVTWLCLDPLLKAVYLLRCFYGESLRTGEDLKAELKVPASGARAVGAAALILFTMAGLHIGEAASPAQDSPAVPATAGVKSPNAAPSPAALDRAIEQVLQRPEFNWRLPREKRIEDESQRSGLARFLDGVIETLRRWSRAVGRGIRAVVRWLGDAIEWLRKNVLGGDRTATKSAGGGREWMVFLQALILVLLALVSAAVVVLFFRTWKRRTARAAIQSQTVPSMPDLTDENVTAGQLPEDEWLKLARELLGRGEPRLAIRAFYLASLAHLAQREMISVAKFKSNRDYEHELRRRARAMPDLQSAFVENGTIFDRVWYGLHEVTQDALRQFQINLEKIRTC